MAARRNPVQTEEHRRRIQTTQLVKRLESIALGATKAEPYQVTAALGLLKKTLPDLTAVEHSGEMQTSYVLRAPLPAQASDEWQTEHAPTIQ